MKRLLLGTIAFALVGASASGAYALDFAAGFRAAKYGPRVEAARYVPGPYTFEQRYQIVLSQEAARAKQNSPLTGLRSVNNGFLRTGPAGRGVIDAAGWYHSVPANQGGATGRWAHIVVR